VKIIISRFIVQEVES